MNKVFQSLPGRINATTAFNIVLSGRQAVKIHAYSLQSESDGQTVYFYDVATGKQLSQKWVFNAREGVISPFSKEGFFVGENVGHDIGLNLANATFVGFWVLYTNEDESIYRI